MAGHIALFGEDENGPFIIHSAPGINVTDDEDVTYTYDTGPRINYGIYGGNNNNDDPYFLKLEIVWDLFENWKDNHDYIYKTWNY